MKYLKYLNVILLMILAIGGPPTTYGSPNGTLEEIVKDVTGLEVIFETILVICQIKKEKYKTTMNIVKKDLFNFGSQSLESLRDAKLNDFEAEIKSVVYAIEDECLLAEGCKFSGDRLEGRKAFEELGKMVDVVRNLPNLEKVSRIKKIVEDEFKNAAVLTELADALDDLKNFPKGTAEDGKFVAKVNVTLPKVVSMTDSFKKVVRAAASFSKAEMTAELVAVADLESNTKSISTQQAALTRLNTTTVLLKQTMEKLLSKEDSFRAVFEKIDSLETLQNAPREGRRFQFLQFLNDNLTNSRMVNLTTVSKEELTKILETAKILKSGSAKWRIQRSKINTPNGFEEKIHRLRTIFHENYGKIVRSALISGLEKCVAGMELKPYIANNSTSNSGDSDGNVIEELRVNNFAEPLLHLLKTLQNSQSTTDHNSTLTNWKQINVSVISSTLRDMKEKVSELSKPGDNSTVELSSWARETGIAVGVECSRNIQPQAESDWSDVKILSMDDSDIKEVVEFASRVAQVIAEVTSEKNAKVLPPPRVVIPVYELTSTTRDLAAIAKALRVMSAVDQNEKAIETVFKRMNDMVDFTGLAGDVWTTEVRACVDRTLDGINLVRKTIAESAPFTDMKKWHPVFEELYALGSCRAGRVFRNLKSLAPIGSLETTLDKIQDLDLTYSSAQFTRAVIHEMRDYFVYHNRDMKLEEIRKKEEEEKRKRGPPPPRSEPWDDFVVFSILAFLAATVPFLIGGILYYYDFL